MVLVAPAVWGFLQAARTSIGPLFLIYLIPVMIGVSLTPLIAYRAFSLLRAYYVLERDGIRLYWGLRSEVIPMSAVLWVRPARELDQALPLPFFRWPGAVTGIRQTAGGDRLEYFAARSTNLIVITTPESIYAVSPENPDEFLQVYEQQNELGSITPLEQQSIYPSFLLARVWDARPARYLLLGGLLLNLALITWVSLVIPGLEQVRLGFGPQAEPIPGVQLLLLPFLSGIFFLIDLFVGLFFFRRNDPRFFTGAPADASILTDWQVLAYLVWGSGAVTTVLFLVAVLFILRTG